MNLTELFRNIAALPPEDIQRLRSEIDSLLMSHDRLDDDDKPLSEDEKIDLIDRALEMLHSRDLQLSGPQCALLGSWILLAKHKLESFASRDLTAELGKKRELSNSTATLNGLKEKGYLISERDSGGSHKQYELTRSGQRAAIKLIQYPPIQEVKRDAA